MNFDKIFPTPLQSMHQDSLPALVRYIGQTAFAEGLWIGIEFLSKSIGKNDGSVNGRVYFQCKPNHGLFIRPNRLALSKK